MKNGLELKLKNDTTVDIHHRVGWSGRGVVSGVVSGGRFVQLGLEIFIFCSARSRNVSVFVQLGLDILSFFSARSRNFQFLFSSV